MAQERPSTSPPPPPSPEKRRVYEFRAERVRALLQEANLEGIWIFSYENRRYLTGFTGTNAQIFLTRERLYLLTDGRYATQAREEAYCDELIIYERLEKPFAQLSRGIALGFEGSGISFSEARTLFQSAGIREPVDLTKALKPLRAQKDEGEVAAILEAIAIAEAVFRKRFEEEPLPLSGKREEELALELEVEIRRRGSRLLPFPVIVASGERSALPHGIASRRSMGTGDPLTLDFGAEWQGYFSDMTFSGSLGTPLPWLKEIVEILREAQRRAIAAMKPGVPVKEVDRIARSFIAQEGYGEAFPHSLGHGVGLNIHEPPSLSAHSEEVLEEGMVVTVEPGIYLPGKGGARLEDMVLIEREGARVLTRIPKGYTLFPGS